MVFFQIFLVFGIFFNFTNSRQYLGLFTLTNCEKKFECSNALVNENRMVLHHSTKKYSEDVHLCTLDVQNNYEKLLHIILNLTERNSSFTLDCRNNTKMNFNYDNQILIFTYMSFELTRIVSSIVLLDDTFVQASVTDQFMYPAYYFDHPLAIYSYESSFDKKIHRDGFIKVKNELNISYEVFLNLHQGPVAHQNEICSKENDQQTAWCLYTKFCPNDCMKTKDVQIFNQSDIDYTMELVKNSSASFILLVGGSLSIELFQRKINITNFFILSYFTETSSSTLTSIPLTSYLNRDIFLNYLGASAFSDFLLYVSDLSNLLLTEDYIWKGILQMEEVQSFIQDTLECKFLQIFHKGYRCGDIFTFEMWQKVPFFFKKNMVKNIIIGNKDVIKSMVALWKKRYYIANIDYKQMLKHEIFHNPTKALQSQPFCDLKKPLCGPGEELIHSLHKEVGWKKSFGWNCRHCSNNFYKTSFGNVEKCQNCPYRMISNENRSFCFDPYQLEMLSFTDRTSYITITISFVLVIFITLTMIVFFVKRDTPIVLSANHKMSAVQLTTHLLLNIAPLLLSLGRLSQTKCALIQIVIGLGFSITVSVNISKTQKIFMIVSKQIIMSKFEILLTKASEWMIIGSVVLVNISLHLYVLFYSPVRLLVEYHENPPVKEEYCSNEIWIFLQMVFAGGLIIANGVQGIRGRNLPSQFRETNHVIYSSFISIMVIFAASAIYFSQQNKVERLMVVCVVIIILNSVHFVLLYTYKMFIILFKSHLNTRRVVNERRLRSFSSNVDKLKRDR